MRDPGGVVRLDVSFTVERGEIVGLAGVEGNGQSQLGSRWRACSVREGAGESLRWRASSTSGARR